MNKAPQKRLIIALILLSMNSSAFSNAQAFLDETNNDSVKRTPQFASGRIIVKLKEGKDPEKDLKVLNAKHKVKKIKKLFAHQKVISNLDQIYIFEVDPKTDVKSMIADYQNNPNVEYAKPDYEVRVQNASALF